MDRQALPYFFNVTPAFDAQVQDCESHFDREPPSAAADLDVTLRGDRAASFPACGMLSIVALCGIGGALSFVDLG